MVIGVLEIKLAVRHARSLKDKRRVVNSLKDRLSNRFNVSIAEVDSQDLRQVSDLGVVQVSSDARYARGSLNSVVDAVRSFRGAELTDYRIEIFHH